MSCAGSRVPGGALGVVMAVADLGLGQVGVGVCRVEVPRAHPLVWAACCVSWFDLALGLAAVASGGLPGRALA